MIRLSELRKIARSFPEVTEEDHFGRPSFRIGGRIFATLPDMRHVNVMIDPFDVDGAVRESPEACSVLMWGKKIAGVRVDLDRAPKELVANLLNVAWRRRAPRRLLNEAAGER